MIKSLKKTGSLSFLSAFMFLFASLFLLSGCGSDSDKNASVSPQILFDKAFENINKKSYEDASQELEEFEKQYPLYKNIADIRLLIAYCYYQINEYEKAIVALNHFSLLHPVHPQAAYASYLKANIYYEQIADVEKDQYITHVTKEALEKLVNQYPDSEYAKDALLKIDLLNNHLAAKSIDIGRFYQARGIYHAAINRFKEVIKNYQTTEMIPEAMQRLTQSYLALGLKKDALKVAIIFGYNYPNHQRYHQTYKLIQKHMK